MELHGNRELTYLYAGGTPFAIHQKQGQTEQLFYLHTDYQGSIRAITNEQGIVIETRDYDAWGRPRNASTLQYTATNPFSVTTITKRGYTFHEHIFEFSLINMNARMYDPVTRRVISPDNYIQAPDNTQSFNRYSYCWNNPLKYTDPDGNLVFVPILIGMAIGGYAGSQVAKAKGYDFNDWQMYAYIAGGAVVGGASGAVGASVATSGAVGAKTTAIAYASYYNSVGMHMVSQGQTSVGVSFGIGNYNFSDNQFNGIWNWGENSTMENVGYCLGAFANFTDLMGAINTPDANYQLRTDNTEIGKLDPGHSSIRKDGESIISFGPKGANRMKSFLGTKSTNKYHDDILERPDLNIKLNSKVVSGLSKLLPKIPYSAGTGIQCAGATSMAGLLSGKFMLNIGLLMLNTPQLTYYSYKYEQVIMMSSILTTVHTTK